MIERIITDPALMRHCALPPKPAAVRPVPTAQRPAWVGSRRERGMSSRIASIAREFSKTRASRQRGCDLCFNWDSFEIAGRRISQKIEAARNMSTLAFALWICVAGSVEYAPRHASLAVSRPHQHILLLH